MLRIFTISAVFHEHALPELHALREHARHDVERTAGRKRHDDAHLAGGKLLSGCRARAQDTRRRERGQELLHVHAE
jgi:hypothetical protein